MKNAFFLTLGLALLVVGCSQPTADAGTSGSSTTGETTTTTGSTPPAGDDKFATNVKPLMVKHCGQCHTGAGAKGGFNVENFNTAADLAKAENAHTLSEVAEQLASNKMPPPNAPQPTPEDRILLSEGLKVP